MEVVQNHPHVSPHIPRIDDISDVDALSGDGADSGMFTYKI